MNAACNASIAVVNSDCLPLMSGGFPAIPGGGNRGGTVNLPVMGFEKRLHVYSARVGHHPIRDCQQCGGPTCRAAVCQVCREEADMSGVSGGGRHTCRRHARLAETMRPCGTMQPYSPQLRVAADLARDYLAQYQGYGGKQTAPVSRSGSETPTSKWPIIESRDLQEV